TRNVILLFVESYVAPRFSASIAACAGPIGTARLKNVTSNAAIVFANLILALLRKPGRAGMRGRLASRMAQLSYRRHRFPPAIILPQSGSLCASPTDHQAHLFGVTRISSRAPLAGN